MLILVSVDMLILVSVDMLMLVSVVDRQQTRKWPP